MCKPTVSFEAKNNPKKLSILLSSSSFHCIDPQTSKGPIPPSKTSVYLTIAIVVTLLIIIEQIFRHAIHLHLTDYHPIFENETHRHIMARHLGVDAIACFTIAFLGYKNKHLVFSNLLTLNRSTQLDKTSHERMFEYQPESHRILLLFIAYQVKNLHDSWYWNDGIIFIAHHIFAAVTAWFGMYPGIAGVYGIFFMGMSEISTCVLCLLANFDDHFGVAGLDKVFPMTKIVLAVMFVVLFVVCRCVLWPILSYHFLLDVKMLLKMGDNIDCKKDDDVNLVKSTKTIKEVSFPLKMMVGANLFLTALQILWLGEIIMTAKKEIEDLL